MKKKVLLCLLAMSAIISTAAAAPLTNFADERNAIDFGGWHTQMAQSNNDKKPDPGIDPEPEPKPGSVCPPHYSYRPPLTITPAMNPYKVLGMSDAGYSTRDNLYGAITLGLNDKTGIQYRYFDIKSPKTDASKQYGKNMEYNLIYSLQRNLAMFAGVNQYKIADTTTNAMSIGLLAKAPVGKNIEAYTIAGIGQHSLRHLEVGLAANVAKDLDVNVGYRVFQGIDRNDTVKAKYNGVIVGITHRFGHVAKKTIVEETIPPVEIVPETPIPEKPAEKIVLSNVNFNFDEASLRPEAYPTLNYVVDIAKENLDWQFLLIGHTDGIGADDYNMELSQRRVNTVKNYIVTNGVDERRIAVDWKGKREPIATNDTAEGRTQNRRVELVIE